MQKRWQATLSAGVSWWSCSEQRTARNDSNTLGWIFRPKQNFQLSRPPMRHAWSTKWAKRKRWHHSQTLHDCVTKPKLKCARHGRNNRAVTSMPARVSFQENVFVEERCQCVHDSSGKLFSYLKLLYSRNFPILESPTIIFSVEIIHQRHL